MNISFKNNTLSIYDFDNLKNIPGVWFIWSSNNINNQKECLTCGQTKNLDKELNWTLRVLANRNLQQLEINEPVCTGRWNFIQSNYKNYEYVLINKGEKNFKT